MDVLGWNSVLVCSHIAYVKSLFSWTSCYIRDTFFFCQIVDRVICSTVLPEMPIDASWQRFSNFRGSRKVHYSVHKNIPIGVVLSHRMRSTISYSASLRKAPLLFYYIHYVSQEFNSFEIFLLMSCLHSSSAASLILRDFIMLVILVENKLHSWLLWISYLLPFHSVNNIHTLSS